MKGSNNMLSNGVCADPKTFSKAGIDINEGRFVHSTNRRHTPPYSPNNNISSSSTIDTQLNARKQK